jgi:SAM-dependent methyltransferase
MRSACAICGAADIYALPIPHDERSVLSDGRILPRPLAKLGCRACGATFHAVAPPPEEVQGFFDDAYSLPSASPEADRARGAAYAAWITSISGPLGASRLLEVGCGSGALLDALTERHPQLPALGLDPACPAERRGENGRPVLRKGRVDDLPDDESFDVVVAVNVVEHTPDPRAFLAQIGGRLRPGGRMFLVHPSAAPPNVELLFFDHLTTFTPAALAAVLPEGLRIAEHHDAPQTIGDFQLAIVTGANAAPTRLPFASDLEAKRRRHLQAWRQMDAALLRRSKGATSLRLFGATQTASLVRAYAPQVWARTESLAVDQPHDAWLLDRDVVAYDRLRPDPGKPMIVAVAPGRQAAVAQRLTRDGHAAIIWDDLFETVEGG